MDLFCSCVCSSPTACAWSVATSLGHGVVEALSPCPLAGCLPLGRAISCNCGKQRKVALVTGGNRGVGYGTAKALLNDGYHVILLCRSTELGNQAGVLCCCAHAHGVGGEPCAAETSMSMRMTRA